MNCPPPVLPAVRWFTYPANFIRIVHRFVFGVGFQLDGAVTLAPVVPREYWDRGFGQTIKWRGRSLAYRMEGGRVSGTYSGDGPQRLEVLLQGGVRHRLALAASASARAWSIA